MLPALTTLPTALARSTNGQAIQVRLNSPLPALPANTPLTVIRSTPQGSFTLQLPSGETISGTSTPSLPQGSTVLLTSGTPAPQTPSQTTPPSLHHSITPSLNPRPLTAQLLPPTPQPTSANTPQPQSTTPNPTASPSPSLHNSITPSLNVIQITITPPPQTTPPSLHHSTTPSLPPTPLTIPPTLTTNSSFINLLSTLSTQNPYQTTPQTTPQSLPNPPQISTISTLSQNSIQATIFNQSSQFIAYPQNITPAGPLPATFTQSPNPTLSGQPATLTLTTSQQATLSFTNQSFSYNLTLPTTLNLPQQTALPATLLTPPQSPPLVLLTATTSTPLPANTSPTTTNIPNNLNVLSILLTGQSLPLPPPNTPLLARVLAAPNTQNQQPILLANGQTATVQLTIENINQNSQLPTGSTLVIEFPTNTPPRILQAIPAGPQNAPANSQTLAQTAAPQGAQTTQALPATGTILQGTIVAQNPVAQNGQSQPQLLLTITSPGPFQGQNLPLTLAQTPPTPLPIGTTLNLQITNNANSLVASLLGFTLPANAQRAHTLTQLSQHWPALQQGLQLLEKSAPQVAQALKNNLPNLANLAPGLLNFTQALAQNSPELAFTQQAATLMRSMGADPTQNLQQLQQLQQRPEDGSWRGTLFPYIENPTDNPRQGGFFWRREESTDPRAPTPTRFIIQLEMSNLGPLQLDGLVAYPQCLLKLRQNTPPSPTFTQQIQELTANLFEQYGLTGGLTVETTKSFPLNPLAEMLAQTENPLPTQA